MTDMLNDLQSSIRQVMTDHANGSDEAQCWQQLNDLGWLLVGVPEEYDGLGAGLAGMSMVVREMAQRVSCAPVLPALAAVDAIVNSSLKDKTELLGRFVSGELVSCSLATSELTYENGKISGGLRAVQSADVASELLVWDHSLSLLALVEVNCEGIDIRSTPTWDVTRRLFDVEFDAVEIDSSRVITTSRDEIEKLLGTLDFLVGADSIGTAEGMFEMTLEHLKVREQFSRPLAMFQALKHRCADIKTQLVAAESLLADKLAAKNLLAAGACVKQFSAASASWIAEDCLQLHGGVGMAAEHDCHLFLKRASLNAHLAHNESEVTQILLADII
jgi:alkylation response protein AidB-like acyl-CoA dehydrogenase